MSLEDKMIQPNPEIELIISAATEKAKFHNHEYVTLEHLLYGIITYEPFNKLLDQYGVDVVGLDKDVDDYVSSQNFLVSNTLDCEPKRTHSLERVLNRAFTQVLFSARQVMQVIRSEEHTSELQSH